MQRFIDRIKDAREGSHVRTWDWLYGKLQTVVIEQREDANEESVRRSISPNKPTPKSKGEGKGKAVPAKGASADDQDQVKDQHAMPSSTAKPRQSLRATKREVGRARKEVHRIGQRSIRAQRAKLLLQSRNRSQRLREASHRSSVCFTRIALEVIHVRSCTKEHQRGRRSQRLHLQKPPPRLPWPRCSLAAFEEPRHQGPACHQ